MEVFEEGVEMVGEDGVVSMSWAMMSLYAYMIRIESVYLANKENEQEHI